MRLRASLLQFAILAFLAAGIGAYVHYTSLQNQARLDADRHAQNLLARTRGRLAAYFAEQIKPVRALASLPEVRTALVHEGAVTAATADVLLGRFQRAFGVEVCYLMRPDGRAVAASNWRDADSFVGRDFGFRPYFQEAMGSTPATYLALGSATGRRGIYYSYPVDAEGAPGPAGVVVIKASVAPIEGLLETAAGVVTLLVDPHGIVFAASDPSWSLRSLRQLSDEEQAEVASTRQFGDGPWPWAGTVVLPDGMVSGPRGTRYLLHETSLEQFPGWKVTLLAESHYDYLSYLRPFFSRNRPLVVPLLALICVLVVLLYRTASQQEDRRRLAEFALRESEERFRSLYNKTPALLQSIDGGGRIMGVSDYWAETMGYAREEVVGSLLTDFMPETSRQRVESVVLPEFLRNGICRDEPCQLQKKNGEVVDVLLSCVAERDAAQNLRGSLSVLADVTAQKRVERRLEEARELLSSYSEDLERQVRERTLEITNILRYTPAVVSLKDLEGRYLLVNQRFEQLFDVEADRIRGTTAKDVFPPAVAERFAAQEQDVIATGAPVSSEETIPLADGVHTHLLVKFPLFDENGRVSRVGSIATDVTALKDAQERLRQLSNRILQGQERERAAIARELHDELGQVLLALKMEASWLQRRLVQVDDVASRRAQAMGETVDATIDEVRGLVMRLRPGVLDDLGLVPALEWVTNEFERRTNIPCTFRHSSVPELDDLVATATYRITQEALTNVARHAAASEVHVCLAGSNGELVLSVSDDGKGFASEGVRDRPGRGVAGIRERAALAGGTVDIESPPGGGTLITFRLPLAGPEQEGAQ